MESNENLIVCQNCGEKNPVTNNFCSKCAAPLGAAPVPASQMPPPPQTVPAYASAPQKYKKSKKKGCGIAVLIVIGIFILIGIIAAIGSGGDSGDTTTTTTKSAAANATTGTTAATKKPTVVSVDTLMDALDDNALKAANTYKGKYVKVTGKLNVIDSSGDYFSIYALNDEFDFIGVQCFITEDQQDTVAEFKTGQKVTVIGTITEVGEIMGYSLDVESIVE